MIFDNIENAAFYFNLSSGIKKGLSFLKNEKLNELPLGRIDIDGDNVFALVQEYDTKEFNVDMWEAHKKYFDIQFIISGNENLYFSRIEKMKSNTIYNEEADYWLFSGKGSYLELCENEFVILSHQDVHQPGVKVSNTSSYVKKIVVKVLL